MIAALHWANVLFALLLAAPAVASAGFAYMIHKDVSTPSGDSLGAVVERTHDLASTNHAQLIQHGQVLADGKLDEVHKLVDDCFRQTLAALETMKETNPRRQGWSARD